MEAIDLANEIEDKVNVMGNSENMKTLVGHLTTMHRTLIQSFVGKFIIPYVKKMAMDYRNGTYDGRNEIACKMCDLMFEGLCGEYPCFRTDDMNLPMI